MNVDALIKSFPQSQPPAACGYSMPAEWEPHEAVWLAWPAAEDLWTENLPEVQREFVGLCDGIANETLRILVPDDRIAKAVRERLGHLPVETHIVPYGDIWLRDTAPVFLKDSAGQLASLAFRFNGWGKKYYLDHDDEVAHRIAKISQNVTSQSFSSEFIFEGGALEVDGEGTCLTSRQCLLNPNRNPSLTEKEIERVLADELNVQKVLWLDDGLMNDHTDGHIDTIARFTSPGHVILMEARDEDDPNRNSLLRMRESLQNETDARGRIIQVDLIPSPGQVVDPAGDIMPASYLNFYISNQTVVVPIYGSRYDEEAVHLIARAFPGRTTIGRSAKAILSGGGAFHCITQQVPRRGRP